jgi:hypothetical protein
MAADTTDAPLSLSKITSAPSDRAALGRFGCARTCSRARWRGGQHYARQLSQLPEWRGSGRSHGLCMPSQQEAFCARAQYAPRQVPSCRTEPGQDGVGVFPVSEPQLTLLAPCRVRVPAPPTAGSRPAGRRGHGRVRDATTPSWVGVTTPGWSFRHPCRRPWSGLLLIPMDGAGGRGRVTAGGRADGGGSVSC